MAPVRIHADELPWPSAGTAIDWLLMRFDDLPDEWKEWISLKPLERFRRSEQIFADYLAMGGSLDPDPDPTSPFDFPELWRAGAAHGRAGLRVLRRGAGEQGH